MVYLTCRQNISLLNSTVQDTRKEGVPLSRSLEEKPLKLLVGILALTRIGRNLVIFVVFVNQVHEDCSTFPKGIAGLVIHKSGDSAVGVELGVSLCLNGVQKQRCG